ncbi:MAG: ATP-grasp fold amidoligase family protein [Gemmatimonadota bacterium]|nr:ATP-grasp fold amidoligase family protein [Gemmatimonadota bacterium]MDQ8173245.1 ATP-grasp fold amidoligase family protein [Gemmatimonadota bacterium]
MSLVRSLRRRVGALGRAFWWHVALEIPAVRRRVDRPVMEGHYLEKFGRLPNLEAPRLLSEKVLWRMLYQYDTVYSRTADKLEARAFITERIGGEYLPAIYAVGRTTGELNLRGLPGPCILKGTHMSGGNIIVRDPAQLDLAATTEALERVLQRRFYLRSREYHYKSIPPRIIAEELLQHQDGQLPADYKFYVFHGKAKMLWVDIDRFGDRRRVVFDEDLKPLVFAGKRGAPDTPFTLPSEIERMREVAEALARGFDFVRVDLYNVDGRIVAGELTFTPGAGVLFAHAPEMDLRYGAMWNLPGH